MASLSGNSYETRDKIKQVQEFLDQEIERVKELKNLLSISGEKVTELERELAQYKATISPTPINSCPPEILSIIFKLSVPEDGNIRHIGRLLFVCRRWHTLVKNDPQMWNNIRICVPAEWDIESWSKSTRLYIDSCIERSHATGLHIEIDFHALRTTEQQIKERLRYGFLQLLAFNKAEVDHDRVGRWLEGLDYDEWEDHHEMTSPCLPGHALDLIGRLVGVGGEAGLRWESLTLLFPSSDELAIAIWDRVLPNVVNLSRLHFIGSRWAHFYWSDYYIEDGASILYLPQVKDLRMETLIGWEKFLFFDPSSIQRLAVELAFKEEFFSELARFSQLRTLTLASPRIPKGMQVRASTTNRISIPTLEELVLIGEFDHLDTVMFDLPNLKRVRMESKWPIAAIPTIQPLEVHWEADSNMYSCDDILKMADKDIRGLLLSYKSSDSFSVASFPKGNVLKVLKELLTEGTLPPRWKTVSFHDTYGGVETMNIDTILYR